MISEVETVRWVGDGTFLGATGEGKAGRRSCSFQGVGFRFVLSKFLGLMLRGVEIRFL